MNKIYQILYLLLIILSLSVQSQVVNKQYNGKINIMYSLTAENITFEPLNKQTSGLFSEPEDVKELVKIPAQLEITDSNGNLVTSSSILFTLDTLLLAGKNNHYRLLNETDKKALYLKQKDSVIFEGSKFETSDVGEWKGQYPAIYRDQAQKTKSFYLKDKTLKYEEQYNKIIGPSNTWVLIMLFIIVLMPLTLGFIIILIIYRKNPFTKSKLLDMKPIYLLCVMAIGTGAVIHASYQPAIALGYGAEHTKVLLEIGVIAIIGLTIVISVIKKTFPPRAAQSNAL